jgi:hypothetical protein
MAFHSLICSFAYAIFTGYCHLLSANIYWALRPLCKRQEDINVALKGCSLVGVDSYVNKSL